MSESGTKKEAIVIGVDFGTTFSGVAWCYTGDPKNIRTIKRWSGNNKNLEKVPSVIQYGIKDTNRYQWGFEVTADAQKPLRWFKLLLQLNGSSNTALYTSDPKELARNYTGDGNQLEHLLNTLATSLPSDKTPLKVTSDYLRGLYKHTRETLDGAYPESFTKCFGKEIALEFWLTVPAIWSDTAKDLTLQAAKRAGFDESQVKIKTVSEPEAAAVHCFKTFKESKDSLKVGDIYVVADCGGGTVDLISYKITSVEPRLKVDECVGGTGGFCGSTALNHRFENLVINRLGLAEWNKMTTVARHNTMLHFDEFLKPRFRPPEYSDEDDDEFETKTYYCPVPGVPNDSSRRTQGGHLLLSPEELKGVFEPTLQEIAGLVQQQICRAENRSGSSITGVLLVGGFGTSRYLYKYLSAKLKGKDGTQVKILRPDDAWSAISQGAVSFGLAARQEREGILPAGSGLVGSRIARFSYGIEVSEAFIASKHPAHKMYYCRFTGRFRCAGRMRWFVRKGDRLPDGQAQVINLIKRCSIDQNELIFPEEIFACELDEPPEELEDPAVHHILTFTADMNGVSPRRYFTRRKCATEAGEYWKIPIDACMLYESAALEFSMKVGGASVGKGTILYNHKLPETGTSTGNSNFTGLYQGIASSLGRFRTMVQEFGPYYF